MIFAKLTYTVPPSDPLELARSPRAKELGFVDPENAYAFLLKEAEALPEDATDVAAFIDGHEVIL